MVSPTPKANISRIDRRFKVIKNRSSRKIRLDIKGTIDTSGSSLRRDAVLISLG